MAILPLTVNLGEHDNPVPSPQSEVSASSLSFEIRLCFILPLMISCYLISFPLQPWLQHAIPPSQPTDPVASRVLVAQPLFRSQILLLPSLKAWNCFFYPLLQILTCPLVAWLAKHRGTIFGIGVNQPSQPFLHYLDFKISRPRILILNYSFSGVTCLSPDLSP